MDERPYRKRECKNGGVAVLEDEGEMMWCGWTLTLTLRLVLVRLVSRPVFDPSAFEFCFDILWDATFHADCVHPSDVFRCRGAKAHIIESSQYPFSFNMYIGLWQRKGEGVCRSGGTKERRTCPLPPRHPARLGVDHGDDSVEIGRRAYLDTIRRAFHLLSRSRIKDRIRT